MCSTVFQLNWERVCNAAKTQDLEFHLLGSTPTRFRQETILVLAAPLSESCFIVAYRLECQVKHLRPSLASND